MNFQRTAYVCCLLCFAVGLQARGSDLYPLLVTETQGTLSKEASNQMIKCATQSGQSGLLQTIARASYGNDTKRFPAALPYRGQIEMLADAVKRIDLKMQESVGQLKVRADGTTTVRQQMFWTGSQLGESPLSGDLMELALQFMTSDFPNSDKYKQSLDLGVLALKSKAIVGNQTLIDNLKIETFERFAELKAPKEDLPVWPIHIFLEYRLDGQKGIGVTFRFVLATTPMKQSRKDLGTSIMDNFVYNPYLEGRGVLEFLFERDYTFQNKTYPAPVAKINFGRIRSGDLVPSSCKNDECNGWVDALPTMYLSVDPADSGWFVRTKAWLASFDRFKILFKSLSLNLRDLSLDPAGTDLLFQVDTYLGGSKIIDMQNAKARNWFEYFAQRQGAIQGEILPSFDASARKLLDDLMATNLDRLVFKSHSP
ncbi:MAG: hypothetical protein NTV34_03525 [Proteobacteria bacterium]|nr:hypothetical protein [Pseudomonadota bacterium]